LIKILRVFSFGFFIMFLVGLLPIPLILFGYGDQFLESGLPEFMWVTVAYWLYSIGVQEPIVQEIGGQAVLLSPIGYALIYLGPSISFGIFARLLQKRLSESQNDETDKE